MWLNLQTIKFEFIYIFHDVTKLIKYIYDRDDPLTSPMDPDPTTTQKWITLAQLKDPNT